MFVGSSELSPNWVPDWQSPHIHNLDAILEILLFIFFALPQGFIKTKKNTNVQSVESNHKLKQHKYGSLRRDQALQTLLHVLNGSLVLTNSEDDEAVPNSVRTCEIDWRLVKGECFEKCEGEGGKKGLLSLTTTDAIKSSTNVCW